MCSYVCNDSGTWDVVYPPGHTTCDSSYQSSLPVPCPRPVIQPLSVQQPSTNQLLEQQMVETMMHPILEGLKAQFGIE